MHPSRFLAAIAIAFTIPLFASVELPRENERWTKLELDDYVIYSSARDSVTRDVAERLQLMRDGLAMITHLNVHPPQRVTVILFPNERSFAPFRDAAMGKKIEHITALFAGSRDAGFIVINTDANGALDRSVYHELTHCFTYNTAGVVLPLWFTEGIAEFYSTFQTYGRDKLRIGTPIPEHLQWLRSRGMPPLAHLFTVDHNSPDYSEATLAGDFYAESWLLVHYLMLGNAERNKGLGPFLQLLAHGEPHASAVEKAFGIKEDQLEIELRHYLVAPTMHVGDYTPAEKHKYTITDPSPASRDAVLLALGKFLAHSPSAARDASPFYDAALKANPNNGDVYAAIAQLANRAGNSAAREEAVQKAVALGSTDSGVYIDAGMALLDSAPNAEKARVLFEKALALNPQSAAAYAGSGAAYALAHEDEKAIAAYTRSLAIERRDDVAFNLVSLYARSGKRAQAEEAIEKYIVPLGDKRLETQARETLVQLDLRRAIELDEAGNVDDAVALAKSVASSAADDTMKREAGKLADGFERHKEITEINRAIAAANQRKYTDALAIVDALLPSIRDADIQSDAKSLRDELAKRVAKKK